jgi:hypothetical protein
MFVTRGSKTLSFLSLIFFPIWIQNLYHWPHAVRVPAVVFYFVYHFILSILLEDFFFKEFINNEFVNVKLSLW